jgi:hypothetical protein
VEEYDWSLTKKKVRGKGGDSSSKLCI